MGNASSVHTHCVCMDAWMPAYKAVSTLKPNSDHLCRIHLPIALLLLLLRKSSPISQDSQSTDSRAGGPPAVLALGGCEAQGALGAAPVPWLTQLLSPSSPCAISQSLLRTARSEGEKHTGEHDDETLSRQAKKQEKHTLALLSRFQKGPQDRGAEPERGGLQPLRGKGLRAHLWPLCPDAAQPAWTPTAFGDLHSHQSVSLLWGLLTSIQQHWIK